MPSTFDTVADIIARTCDIPRDAIAPDSHLLRDLGIDSLDLFDIGYALDDAFGISVPLERWLHAAQMKATAAERRFIVRDLCAVIDANVAAAR